jgi:hypothetical protein
MPASGTRRTLSPVERHTPVLLVLRSGHTRWRSDKHALDGWNGPIGMIVVRKPVAHSPRAVGIVWIGIVRQSAKVPGPWPQRSRVRTGSEHHVAASSPWCHQEATSARLEDRILPVSVEASGLAALYEPRRARGEEESCSEPITQRFAG